MTQDPFAGRSKMPLGEMLVESAGQRLMNANPSRGWGEWSLATAVVTYVDYKILKVDISILTGEDATPSRPFTGIDITFPGGGRRHFFGSLPSPGDYCVVGWAIQESSGGGSSRQPIILTWLPGSPWMGNEWTPYQPVAPSQGFDLAKDREVFKHVYQKTRFKLRTMAPGSILASSEQGADLVLDESASLLNRRGNEVTLRDQDQSLVTRSVNQFHNSAGTRIYSGMVQRDARMLPTQMFSDGLYWETPRQVFPDGEVVSEFYLEDNRDDKEKPLFPESFLTPAQIFTRSPDSLEKSDFAVSKGKNLIRSSEFDPFSFLLRGSYIDSSGSKSFEDQVFDSNDLRGVSGGKPIFRVGFPSDEQTRPTRTVNAAAQFSPNGSLGAVPSGLTEYRIEVAHTTDGSLPVTEQTDGFDADRLPPGEGEVSPNMPFVEFVLGSVVGNDPFGKRALYGVPLRPVIFGDSGKTVARPSLSNALNFPLGDHAATLFKVQPPANSPTDVPVFWSVTKSGKVMINAASPESYSVEGYAANGIRFDSGGNIDLSSSQSVSIQAGTSNREYSLDLSSADGAVRIFGGGRTDSGRAVSESALGNSGVAPSVLVEGENVVLKSTNQLSLNAPTLNFGNASQLSLKSQNSINLASGENISVTTKISEQTYVGKHSVLVSGPPDFNIANAPTGILTTTIAATPATGFPGAGLVESKLVLMGDETNTVGVLGPSNYLKTYVTAGIHEVGTNAGNIGFRATANRVDINSVSGVAVTAATGVAAVTAATGAVLISAATNASIVAPAITATGTAITLGSPGVSVGPIMCGSDRDPLTGIPYSALGLVPRGQNLSVV